jgi:glycosyltransferase involved in cell wall biosynthesis
MDLWRVRKVTADLDIVNIQYQAAAYGAMRPPIHFLPHFSVQPTTVTFHDLRPPYLFPKAGEFRERAIWGMSRGAAGLIITNAEDYQRCCAKEGLPPVAEIPIGSNIPRDPPETFSPSVWRTDHGIGRDDFVLGYFGFLNDSKGGDILMHALAALHAEGLSARLVLIGDQSGSSDTTNTAYSKQVNDLAVDLHIDDYILRTGYLTPTETSAALLSCDLMVMPYRDGVSFRRGSFLACLAHGRAIVTTRPSLPQTGLRPGENVILSRPEAKAVATAVKKLHSNPSLRKNIESGAVRLSEQFQWTQISERLERFFEEVLSQHKD